MDSPSGLLLRIGIRLMLFILIFALCALFGISEYRKSNAIAYKESIKLIRSHAAARQYIGPRIRRDWLIQGSPVFIGAGKRLEFAYPVAGRLNRAKVKVTAIGDEGRLTSLTVSLLVKKHEEVVIVHNY